MPRTSRLAAILVDRVDGHETHYLVFYNTPAWEASCEWARFHGIDPMVVVAGHRVVRDPVAHVIAYTAIVRDEDGRIVYDGYGARIEDRTERGEAGPMPFPPEVLALKAETTR